MARPRRPKGFDYQRRLGKCIWCDAELLELFDFTYLVWVKQRGQS